MNSLTAPVLVGVFVFVISQYFLKLILEPIIQFRKLLSDISHSLLLHQGLILSGEAKDELLQRKIQELSALLRSSVYMIPFYRGLWILRIFGLPKKENILLACRKLNDLSYGVNTHNEDVSEIAQKNEKILKKISQFLPIETTFMLNEELNP